MRQQHVEVLLLVRVRVIGDHSRLRHGGSSEQDGHVGIAGYPLVLVVAVRAGGVAVWERGVAHAVAAELLDEHVHVMPPGSRG